MKRYIAALGALALIGGIAPADAQNVIPGFLYPRTSALPPTGAATALSADPNAPRWVQLEEYGPSGELRRFWELVYPQDNPANYHGFHTPTD